MKKFFMFAAMASVAFVSCLKNDPTPKANPVGEKQIVFSSPVVGTPTKGAEINGTTFPVDTNFAVFAYYQQGNGAYNYNDATVELYMDEVKCSAKKDSEGKLPNVDGTEQDGKGAWFPADGSKYYWPKNGLLTFVAASPAEDDVEAACHYTIESTNRTLVLNYEAPYELADTAKQVDLLYSDWKKDCSASKHETNITYDGVELAFHHALCIVRINVKAEDDAAAAAVKVTGLSINNVYRKGTFTLLADDATPVWSADAATNYVIVPFTEDAYLEQTTAAQLADPTAGPVAKDDSRAITTTAERQASYILIPQTFLGEANITINYAIRHGNKWLNQVYVYPLSKDTSLEVAKGTGASNLTGWEKGTRYTYNITLGVDEVYFAPSVSAWEDVEVNFDNEKQQY